MARLRLRCFDPRAGWPPGLVKEYDEAVARDLLRMSPYYVEVKGDDPQPSPEDLAHAAHLATRLVTLQQACQSCAERRELARRRRLGLL